ncbi:MAG: hypothetical protein QM811_08560 [Pirellulales bacterium]
MIVAHGGSATGYVLTLVQGRPKLFTRSAKGTAEVQAKEAIQGAHTVTAVIGKQGKLTLAVDGKSVGEAAGVELTVMPTDGLQIGRDEAGKIGDYKGENPFSGKVESVVIELE